ncbi:phosphodiester glycosidase family protein [Paenibacillus marinisediminis]
MKLRRVAAVLGCALMMSGLFQYSTVEAAAMKSYGYMDTKANRTFVPIRYLSEHLKYEVKWDQPNQRVTVSNGEQAATFTVGKNTATVNDRTITLDAAPFIQGGTTYVPIRFISDVMKLDIKWDNTASVMEFQSNGNTNRLPIVPLNRVIQSNPIEQKQQTFMVGKKRIPATILQVDLLNPNIKLGIAVANNQPGTVDSLKDMAVSSKAIAAINGTFFNAYSETSYKAPYGYIVQNGKVVHKSSGDTRSVLYFDRANIVEIVSGADFPQLIRDEKVQGALQAGPRLVTNGNITVDPVNEGFKDPKILTNSGARSAVGITKDHKLILLTTSSATIPELAQVMKQAGAYQAMNLDGGASSCLYYNGKYLTEPGREISNALLIYNQ